jgi:hypothetical protein
VTAPLTFHPTYPGGRILLKLGQHDVGALFPPLGEGQHHYPWVWRFWLGGVTGTKEGRAKTELAAKSALLAEARDWLRKAGLQHG